MIFALTQDNKFKDKKCMLLIFTATFSSTKT